MEGPRARGVRGAPGVSPTPFLAAGTGFALFALALPLLAAGVVSVQVDPISGALGGEFSGVEQSKRGDRITNAMLRRTPRFPVSELVPATSRKEAREEQWPECSRSASVGEAGPGASC